MSSSRDRIRAATVGAPKHFKKEEVEVGGEKIELRQMSILQRQEVARRCIEGEMVNRTRMRIFSLIECAYDPATGERVFEETDFESMVSMPAGSWVDELAEKVAVLAYAKDAEKNSEGTSSD